MQVLGRGFCENALTHQTTSSGVSAAADDGTRAAPEIAKALAIAADRISLIDRHSQSVPPIDSQEIRSGRATKLGADLLPSCAGRIQR
jgi:hypothetical protein